MKSALLVLIALLCAVPAWAQNPDSYRVRIYAPGGTAAIKALSFDATVVFCNQVPSTSALTTNPTKIEWDDKLNAGKKCVYTDPGTGVLSGLPLGPYELTIWAVSVGGTSPESARVPFVVAVTPAVPEAPTGVKAFR